MRGSTSRSGLQRRRPARCRGAPRRARHRASVIRLRGRRPPRIQAAEPVEDRRGVVVERRHVVAVLEHDLGRVGAGDPVEQHLRCTGSTTWSSRLRKTSTGWVTLQVGPGGDPQPAQLHHRPGRQLRVGELGDAGLLDVAGDRRPARREQAQQRQQLGVRPLGQQRWVDQHQPGDVVAASRPAGSPACRPSTARRRTRGRTRRPRRVEGLADRRRPVVVGSRSVLPAGAVAGQQRAAHVSPRRRGARPTAACSAGCR